MYHLSVSTGLDITTKDPANTTAALRTELERHLADGAVTWSVTIDGLPGKHMGRIHIPDPQSPDSNEFIDDLVATLLCNLTADHHPRSLEAIQQVHQTNTDGTQCPVASAHQATGARTSHGRQPRPR